jgi:acyl-CoA thioesterase-2
MSDLADLLAVLDLTPVDGNEVPAGRAQFTATSLDEGHGVVFGGQLLAQSIVAAASTMPDKQVKSLHTVFARGAGVGAPLDIEVEVLHQGRALGSASVTVRQGDRVCTRSTALLHAPDPDLIRHEPPMPDAGSPDDLERRPTPPWWDVRIVGEVDISDPALVGPAELGVWTRFPDAPTDDQTVAQALLAYASDGFLIATAMRPHEGVGQSQAHVTISTTVLSHTLTFHEPFDASRWLLLWHDSAYAGRGRSYGKADVFTEDGHLVASYVQENMIRDFPEGQAPPTGGRSKH